MFEFYHNSHPKKGRGGEGVCLSPKRECKSSGDQVSCLSELIADSNLGLLKILRMPCATGPLTRG